MQISRSTSLLLALVTVLAVGCDDTSTGSDASAPDAGAAADAGTLTDAGAADTGTPDAGQAETCEATFTWWQKDAYLDAPGRGSAFWPPHTTTSMTVTCTPTGGTAETVVDTERVNHGTSTADVDMAGTQILEAVRTETAMGTRADLTALATAYESCECGTTFLSLDALSDTAAMDLVTELATYLNANMTCPAAAGGVGQLISDLMAGDIAAVLALGPMCTFTAGSWQEGLNDALATVVAVTSDVLADYHVCNDDALLQAGLWDAYVSTGTVSACDPGAALCSGPEWFLPCTEDDRSGCLETSP